MGKKNKESKNPVSEKKFILINRKSVNGTVK